MPHAPSAAARPHADYIAIGLSLACLAHCLALPLAAAFLPLLSTQAEAAWVHWAFVALAAPVSAWALAWPPRGALGPAPVALAALGIAALIAGAAGWPAHELETPITVIGGSLISAAHLINLRRRRHRHPG